MTQSSGDGIGSASQRRIIERALADPNFRNRLLEHPRAAIEEVLGISISSADTIRVVEEQPGEVILVLPARPLEPGPGLSDEDLEHVSGGMTMNITALTCCGVCM